MSPAHCRPSAEREKKLLHLRFRAYFCAATPWIERKVKSFTIDHNSGPAQCSDKFAPQGLAGILQILLEVMLRAVTTVTSRRSVVAKRKLKTLHRAGSLKAFVHPRLEYLSRYHDWALFLYHDRALLILLLSHEH